MDTQITPTIGYKK